MENNILGRDNIINISFKAFKRVQELTGNNTNIVDLIEKMPELSDNDSLYQWEEETSDNLLNKRRKIIWKN